MKILTLDDLYKKVETETQEIKYVNYWAEPTESFLSYYIQNHGLETHINIGKEKIPICNGCKVCQVSHIEKYKGEYPSHPIESLRKLKADPTGFLTHSLQIQCPYIPESYSDYASTLLPGIGSSEIKSILPNIDPVAFAKQFLRWHPRAHQELALRCQSKKKVYRFGRRGGKSEVLCVEILYHAFTKIREYYDEDLHENVMGIRILICCPFDSQVTAIFNKLKEFLENNIDLKKTYKYKQSPYHSITFENGAIISGFTTGSNGASVVRGQDAHVIILDEVDYMTLKDFETILPIANSHADCLMRVASTPSGLRSKFYQWCQEQPDWKEYYFPTAVIDETPFKQTKMDWKTLRREMRKEYTNDSWIQEVMAVFISNADGVFSSSTIVKSMANYRYEDIREAKAMGQIIHGFKYSLGVDWNTSFGTWICITGYHPSIGLQVMEIVNIPKQDFTQLKGLEGITKLLSFWQPEYVYVDKGHGQTQWETLRMWSSQQKPGTYEFSVGKKLKTYDFGSKVIIKDPSSGRLLEHPAKPFLVENAVRRMEDGYVKFSNEDDLLKKQMQNFIIKNRQQNGTPIYGQNNTNIGDHALDAFMLSLVAFTLEEGPLAIRRGNTGFIGIAESFGHQMLAEKVFSEKDLEENPKTGAELVAYLRELKKAEMDQRNISANKDKKVYQYSHSAERSFDDGTDNPIPKNINVFSLLDRKNQPYSKPNTGRLIR